MIDDIAIFIIINEKATIFPKDDMMDDNKFKTLQYEKMVENSFLYLVSFKEVFSHMIHLSGFTSSNKYMNRAIFPKDLPPFYRKLFPCNIKKFTKHVILLYIILFCKVFTYKLCLRLFYLIIDFVKIDVYILESHKLSDTLKRSAFIFIILKTHIILKICFHTSGY